MSPPKFGPQLNLPLKIVGGGRVTSAALLTRDEIVRGLTEQGVPLARAEAAADRECSSSLQAYARRFESEMRKAILDRIGPDPAAIVFPVMLTLPWSALVSDNRKYSPSKRRQSDGGEHGIMILRPEYRAAKAKTKSIAKDALPVDADPVSIPLELRSRVWVPDNRPGHDVPNFAKCCHDALKGVVYTDDQWLHRACWERAGVDVDRPRAEITITPLQESP